MGEFYIKHDKEAIRIDTKFSKFESLEQIMLLAAAEFIKKGKTEELKLIISIIEGRLSEEDTFY